MGQLCDQENRHGRQLYDLAIADAGQGKRTYTLSSAGKDTVEVTLNVLIPFSRITRIEVDGRGVDVKCLAKSIAKPWRPSLPRCRPARHYRLS